MKPYLALPFAFLVACGTADDDKSTDTDATGATDTVDDTDATTETDDTTDTDTVVDTDETDASDDTDDGSGPLAANAPGEGLFSWSSPPASTTNTCGFDGGQIGNGYVVSNLDTTEQTFEIQADSGAGQKVTCTYKTGGDFSCGPEFTEYDLSEYDMTGIVTITTSHEGTFEPYTGTFNGDEYTFPINWAFSIYTSYEGTCTASAQDCVIAAMNGFNFDTLPCFTTLSGTTYSFDDPNFPSAH